MVCPLIFPLSIYNGKGMSVSQVFRVETKAVCDQSKLWSQREMGLKMNAAFQGSIKDEGML